MAHRSFAKIVEAAGVIFHFAVPASDRGRHRARHCGRSIPRALSGPVDYNVGNPLRGQNSRGPRSDDVSHSLVAAARMERKRRSCPTNASGRPGGLAFLARRGPFVSAQGTHPASGRERPASPAGACGWSIAIRIPFLNGQSALFFPASKATERLLGEHGLLRFVVPRNRKMSARGRFVFSLCPYQTAHSAQATPTPGTDRRRAHPLRRCKRRVYSRMGPRSSGIAGDSSHQ